MSFAHTLDDAAAETNHHTQYFEDDSATARSTTTAGGQCAPGPGPSVRGEHEATLRRADLPPHTLSQLDATGWELYHVEEDFAETTRTSPPTTATA